MRVQRTRAACFARSRSPLTRCPLGARAERVAVLRLIAGAFIAAFADAALAQTRWEAYIARPTPERAALVEVISYSSSVDPETQTDQDLPVLEVQVISCDSEAVRLAFRLLPKSDGDVAEQLCIMLGRVIRTKPKLFLESLKAAELDSGLLGGLVGNFGQEYVDREEADAYEARARIKALLTVKDSSLKSIRDGCVRLLRNVAGA